MLSFKRSASLIAENASHIAGGVNSNFRIGMQGGPLVFARGEGAYLIDADGNRLIDYYCGMGRHGAGPYPGRGCPRRAAAGGAGHPVRRADRNRIRSRAPVVRAYPPPPSASVSAPRGRKRRRRRCGWRAPPTGRHVILKFEGHYHGWFDNILWSTAPGENAAGPAEAPVPVAGSVGQEPVGALEVMGWNDLARLESAAGQRRYRRRADGTGDVQPGRHRATAGATWKAHWPPAAATARCWSSMK